MNQTQVSSSGNLSLSFTSSDINQIQVSTNSENIPPSFSFTTIYSNSQDNNALITSPRQNANAFHVTTMVQDIHPQYDNMQTLPQQTLQTTLKTTLFHPTTFFYRPLNEFCHYYVNCKEICYDTVNYLLNKLLKENNVQSKENEYIFYYQQQHDARFINYNFKSLFMVSNK
ncbi:hypothetical protein RhiirA5_427307 [Rhizophagus irregularis]|uniref:Uncharacterized protein n=1 Tax=Rhizophagus irregularis TaxID=588596 RepID=A0A2I1EM72_9GLOM|nr:hypothetical protein RhiirA5_427307 [Rhizophagus irregularis]PKY23192.1 hypothetical protein RhiirB3_437332 [Rhizophagus irregularis]CAB4494094.1 unnamed protein product [Rhizophagus irregularis]CAB5162462.1 unnamed protein product [Rhizophagus irregularis]CAB5384442.1 unnamed protein product [Rhizophagus irregularis]